MDALEYFKIKKRMTNKCEMDCDKCLLDRKIIEWEKKHPIISNMDKYKEIIRETFGDNAYLQWLIKRHGETEFSKIPLDDSRLNDNGFMFTISAKDIKFKAVFNCELNI